jgi:hypothetical protein
VMMNELWIMLGLIIAAAALFWVLARFRLL